jgi:choline dehydrogenase-like flavoprotein
MGSTPASSVVDSWQRCWDHENLFAVGCGSFPTMGTSNPTLTLAATTFRTARAILKDLEAYAPASGSAPTGEERRP